MKCFVVIYTNKKGMRFSTVEPSFTTALNVKLSAIEKGFTDVSMHEINNSIGKETGTVNPSKPNPYFLDKLSGFINDEFIHSLMKLCIILAAIILIIVFSSFIVISIKLIFSHN